MSLDLRCPDAVTLIVETHAHVLMVGVHLARLLIDVSLTVALAAPSYIFATAAYPFASRTDVRQHAPCTIIFDGDDLNAASFTVVRA